MHTLLTVTNSLGLYTVPAAVEWSAAHCRLLVRGGWPAAPASCSEYVDGVGSCLLPLAAMVLAAEEFRKRAAELEGPLHARPSRVGVDAEGLLQLPVDLYALLGCTSSRHMPLNILTRAHQANWRCIS